MTRSGLCRPANPLPSWGIGRVSETYFLRKKKTQGPFPLAAKARKFLLTPAGQDWPAGWAALSSWPRPTYSSDGAGSAGKDSSPHAASTATGRHKSQVPAIPHMTADSHWIKYPNVKAKTINLLEEDQG